RPAHRHGPHRRRSHVFPGARARAPCRRTELTMTTVPVQPTDEQVTAPPRPEKTSGGAFNARQLVTSLPDALRKLDPRQMWRNPVMFIVEVGAALTTVLAIAQPFLGRQVSGGTATSVAFTWWIAVWLWLTVIFATLAEAVAEGRGKAQAVSL